MNEPCAIGVELDRPPGSADAVLPQVYDQLRSLARRYLRAAPPGQTLQPTALVHEAYLRIARADAAGLRWTSSAHFVALAAQAMRRVLIDRARARQTAKRGGTREPLRADQLARPAAADDHFLILLDGALARLSSIDPALVRVVELHFFCGLSFLEIAGLLDVAPITVKRDWKLAKGWLHRAITGGAA